MTTLHEETLTDADNETTRSPEAQQETAVLAEATVAAVAAASAADGSLSSSSNHKVSKTIPIDHQPLSSVEYGHL